MCKHMPRHGGGPRQWLAKLQAEEGLPPIDRSAHEMKFICKTVHVGGTFDQMNLCGVILVQRHGGQQLTQESVSQLRNLDRAACVACDTIRSRCHRCSFCKSDTPLRDLVGDTFQDRRQPGHQDAAPGGPPTVHQPLHSSPVPPGDHLDDSPVPTDPTELGLRNSSHQCRMCRGGACFFGWWKVQGNARRNEGTGIGSLPHVKLAPMSSPSLHRRTTGTFGRNRLLCRSRAEEASASRT